MTEREVAGRLGLAQRCPAGCEGRWQVVRGQRGWRRLLPLRDRAMDIVDLRKAILGEGSGEPASVSLLVRAATPGVIQLSAAGAL